MKIQNDSHSPVTISPHILPNIIIALTADEGTLKGINKIHHLLRISVITVQFLVSDAVMEYLKRKRRRRSSVGILSEGD
jgi:hypothetical protein